MSEEDPLLVTMSFRTEKPVPCINGRLATVSMLRALAHPDRCAWPEHEHQSLLRYRAIWTCLMPGRAPGGDGAARALRRTLSRADPLDEQIEKLTIDARDRRVR